MRKSSVSAQEIAEINEYKRRETRATGFSLMSVRDRGAEQLSNGVVVEWHSDARLPDGAVRRYVPSGTVMIDNKPYDIDELQKVLRWA